MAKNIVSIPDLPTMHLDQISQNSNEDLSKFIDYAADSKQLSHQISHQKILQNFVGAYVTFADLCRLIPELHEEQNFGIAMHRHKYTSQVLSHDYYSLTFIYDGILLVITREKNIRSQCWVCTDNPT